MSVIPSDIVIYGSANMPEADGVTIGGAFDSSKRADFFDISPNGTINVVSSSAADTGVKATYFIRDTTGATATVTTQLNGTAVVLGATTAERILAGVITGGAIAGIANPGGTTAVGDCAIVANTKVLAGRTLQLGANPTGATPTLLTLQAGDGTGVSIGHIIRGLTGSGVGQMRKIIAVTGYGTDVVAVSGSYGTGTGLPTLNSTYDVLQGLLFEKGPNPVTAITRLFATAAADTPGGSQRIFYEKVFVTNNNTVTALTPQSGSTGVAVQITGNSPALSAGVTLDLGPETSFNGTATVANRQTAAPGVSFTVQPANVFAPSPGNLAPGNAPNAAGALGLWLRLTVPAGASPYKGAATVQTLGNTT